MNKSFYYLLAPCIYLSSTCNFFSEDYKNFLQKNQNKVPKQEKELLKKLEIINIESGFSNVYIDRLHSSITTNLKELSFLSIKQGRFTSG